MDLHAKNAKDCWDIARQDAEAYQRRMHNPKATAGQVALCRAARDAADRIALRIRYGRKHLRKRKP